MSIATDVKVREHDKAIKELMERVAALESKPKPLGLPVVEKRQQEQRPGRH